ncbi:MAG TPA: stalk domain-containing protein, partial [Fimbriimonadaceae bacterium]|nr:stalk domain-containing protein [Fimbriimonadaceae bacterium]
GPNSDQFVIGGVVGGFVLGSLIKKPFEGAFVGALAGIIMAEANKKQNDVAIKRGTRMGALFERDLRISYDGRWDGDYRRNDEWNRNDDYRRDDDWNRDDDWRRDDDWQRQDEWRREDYQRTDEWRQDPYGREIEVKYGNRILRFARNEAPYRLGGTVMVPLERTAAQLGLDVSKSAGGRTILVEDEESLLKLEQDSADFRLNGRRGTLPRNVVSRDGVIYVPVEALAQMKREFVYVNGSKVGNSA